MDFCKSKIMEIVRSQLALDMNCREQDFLTNGITFCLAKLNEGRRMFERQKPYLEIATMGNGTVVSADIDILVKIKPIIENKSRDDLFSSPFLYGHSLYYVPDCTRIKELPCPDEFTFHVGEGKEIHHLYEFQGFNNALSYDKNHIRPDILATYVMKGDIVAAVAGASIDSKTMWQIGIDVLPPYRNVGLASCLVCNLALMIMERGIVPYYGTASSNIPSQAVAYRSGLIPTWMCTYKNLFDGKSTYNVNIE